MSRKRYESYTLLGKTMYDLALEKEGVEGPYGVANHMSQALAREVKGPSVSEYFRGTYNPPPQFVEDFARVFNLSEEERGRLAWIYAYRFLSAA